MRVVICIGIVLTAAGCASSGIPMSAVSTDPTLVEAPGQFILEVGSNNRVQPTRHEVPRTPPQLLPALVEAYNGLGIEIAQYDTAAFLLGTPSMALPDRRLAGELVSRSLDCGRTVTGVPVADRYTVTVQIFTQLLPNSDGTEVRSVVTGRALSPTTNDAAVRCVSTGYLESRIANALIGIS